MNDKIPHIDSNAMAKFLSGEANVSEINNLCDWLELSDENKDEFARFEKVWSAAKISGRKPFNANKAWSKVNRHIFVKTRNLRIFYSGVAAAVIAVLFVVSQLFYPEISNSKFAISSPNGTVNATLPDGSDVVLAEKSKIKYQFNTKKNTRVAKLDGKAFFHVKRDTTHRFVVKAGYGEVEVLGTKFSVDLLKSTDVQVDVLSGKVKVFLPRATGDTLSLIITDNETAIISEKNDTIIRKAQDASVFYMINKTITFKNLNLDTIVSEMQECYSVDIKIDSAVDRSLKFSSSFKDNSPEEILKVITETLDLDFYKEGDVFYITKSSNDE